MLFTYHTDFPGGSDGKASAYNVGGLGSIPGSVRSPGEGNGNPSQYSCLENPIDRRAWQATVYGVARSQTRLSDFTFTFTYSIIHNIKMYWLLIFSIFRKLWIHDHNKFQDIFNIPQRKSMGGWVSRLVVSDSLRPQELQPIRLLCPWDFPGKNTGMDCHFLLQGIFPTQDSCIQTDSLPTEL